MNNDCKYMNKNLLIKLIRHKLSITFREAIF